MVSKMKPSLEITEDIFLILYLHKDLRDPKSLLSGLQLTLDLTTNPVGIGTTQKIFLDGFTDPDVPPAIIVEGFRVGARAKFNQQDLCTVPDVLQVALAGVGTFSAPIRMLNGDGTSGPSRTKEFNVGFVGLLLTVFLVVYSHCKRIIHCMLVKVFVLSLMMVHCLMVLILMKFTLRSQMILKTRL